jgi:hypothetical protein
MKVLCGQFCVCFQVDLLKFFSLELSGLMQTPTAAQLLPSSVKLSSTANENPHNECVSESQKIKLESSSKVRIVSFNVV